MCSNDATFCQITLTTCHYRATELTMHGSQQERRDVATFVIDGVNANIRRLE